MLIVKTFSLNFFQYLFLAVLGLCTRRGLFSSCSKQGGGGVNSSLWCMGFSLRWLLTLGSTGSRQIAFRRGSSRALGHGLGCSMACGFFPDQGWNPCFLPWQSDSYSLCHKGSPNLGKRKVHFFWVVVGMTLCDPSCVYGQKRLLPSHIYALLCHMIS